MPDRGAENGVEPGVLLWKVVDELDANGVDLERQTLHDYVDFDALRLLLQSGEKISVTVEVDDVQLSINSAGVVSAS